MRANIQIDIDEDTGEVTMSSYGDGEALELANELIELAINGGLDSFVGTDLQIMNVQ